MEAQTHEVGSTLFEEFEPVAPRVGGIEAAVAGKCLVVDDRDIVGTQKLAQSLQVGNNKREMCFLCRLKLAFNADVDLLGGALEPAAPAFAQRRRLFNLLHAQKTAIKFARCRLATLWRSDLNVVDAQNAFFHTKNRIPAALECVLTVTRVRVA